MTTNNQVAEANVKYLVNVTGQTVPAGYLCQSGYKQTEVGVIPEEWEVITIDQALSNKLVLDQMDGNHGELYPKSHEFSSFGIPYIGATDFDSGQVNYKKCKYLPMSRAKKFKKGIAKDGDVLFAHNATVGPVALLKTDLEFVILSTTATYYRCDLDKLNNKYLARFFESEFFIKQYSAVMSQSTRNQVPILAQRKFLIVLPTIQEQTAIANALSDVDALISELEKLIAKKQAIKTATMQQLLTGRTRLPQFALREDGTPKGYKQSELGEIPEDWAVIDMGKLGTFGRGRVISHNEINRSFTKLYPVYSSQTSNEGVMGYLDTYDFEGEFVTWTTDGVNAGKVFYRNGKFNCTNVCGVIRVKDVDARYIAIAMDQEARKYVSTNLANPKLMNGVAKQVLIRIPNVREEQTAIATILIDMDEEIQTLQKRLAKTRQIKQGMMQELLTGRIRLISGKLTVDSGK